MPHVRSSNKRIRTTPTTNGPAFEETYMPTDPTVATTEPDTTLTPDVNPDRAQVAAVGNPRTVAEVAYVEVATADLLVPSDAPDPVPALRATIAEQSARIAELEQRIAVGYTAEVEAMRAHVAAKDKRIAALEAESQVSAQVITALESRPAVDPTPPRPHSCDPTPPPTFADRRPSCPGR